MVRSSRWVKRGAVWRLWCLFAVLLMWLGLRPAYAITGTVTGKFDESLVLSACAEGYASPSFTLYLKTGGKFSLKVSGRVFTGTFTRNASQTSLVFTLDTASRNRLAAAVARWASSRCGATVTITRYSAPVFKVGIRYGASRSSSCNISGAMSVSATGRTDYGSGSARYRVAIWEACFEGKP